MENNNTTENKPKSIKKRRATKILLILYVVALILHFIPALAASAKTLADITKFYYPLSDCLTEHPEGNQHYLYAQIRKSRSVPNHPDYTSEEFRTIYIIFDDNALFTENNGVMSFDITTIDKAYGDYWYYEDANNGGSLGGSNVGDEYRNLSSFFSISALSITDDCSQISFTARNTNLTDLQVQYMEYNIDGLTGKYSSVRVLFTPALSGEVDRSFNDHGKTGYFENFDFEIWNNGSEAIQYKMYIVEKNQTNTRPVITDQNETYKQYDTLRYDDDEVFIYYTKDWVYSTETEVEKHASDNNGSWLNPNIFHKTSSEPKLRYKGTDWHYLEAGGYKHQPIYYSQVNLKEDTLYTVYVLAQTCPYTSASTIWSDEGNTDNKSMTAAEYDIVYQSDFTMLQYSDVKYDPEDSRNGVLPYDGYQGLLDQTVYDVSYDAEQDSNGNINYSGFSFDKSQIPDTYGNTPSNLDGGAEIISNTSGVFRFFSVIFGVFPPEVNKILSISLWVGFALFLIRRLT